MIRERIHKIFSKNAGTSSTGRKAVPADAVRGLNTIYAYCEDVILAEGSIYVLTRDSENGEILGGIDRTTGKYGEWILYAMAIDDAMQLGLPEIGDPLEIRYFGISPTGNSARAVKFQYGGLVPEGFGPMARRGIQNLASAVN